MTAPVFGSFSRRYSEAVPRRIKGVSARPLNNSRRLIVRATGWSSLSPAFIEIPPFHECPQFAIGHAAGQHPEATVGMDVEETAVSQSLYDLLDVPGNQVGFLHFIIFDIDDPNSKADLGVEVAEG